MRAKKLYEDLYDILRPKSEDAILKYLRVSVPYFKRQIKPFVQEIHEYIRENGMYIPDKEPKFFKKIVQMGYGFEFETSLKWMYSHAKAKDRKFEFAYYFDSPRSSFYLTEMIFNRRGAYWENEFHNIVLKDLDKIERIIK